MRKIHLSRPEIIWMMDCAGCTPDARKWAAAGYVGSLESLIARVPGYQWAMAVAIEITVISKAWTSPHGMGYASR